MLNLLLGTNFWRLVIVLLMGFASGLPLALSGNTLQAWLSADGIDIGTIGFFTLVGLPYTFKFLWAPLIDRFDIPYLSRRKGWLIITQCGIGVTLLALASRNPHDNINLFGYLALCVAVFSATQDIVVDAFRTDMIEAKQRGIAAALYVFGYRLAMILSGGIAFIWADTIKGNGWAWSKIYLIMAYIMFAAAAISAVFLPEIKSQITRKKTEVKNDLLGFLGVMIAVVIGYLFTTKLANPLAFKALTHWFPADPASTTNNLKVWSDLTGLLFGLVLTIPLTWYASILCKYETLNTSLKNYFSLKGSLEILIFIILYKLGDAFAGSLLTPFLLNGAGFSSAEIGVANKVIGIWLTIAGALMGGTLMIKLGLYRSLMSFGILQLLSNLGFWMVAIKGKGAWGEILLPAFDWVFVSLKEQTSIDLLLIFAVATENITGGMGTAAFVALLMSLCNQKFTATQYALLSAFAAVGRVWVGPLAGAIAVSSGWPTFFIISSVFAAPGLYLLFRLKSTIKELETPRNINLLDD